jgi:Helix-hairpin-helix motif
VPTPCEILIRNFYDDGSVISGFCLFIYANEDGQIDGFAEVESSERAVRDVLRFPQPRPGRVGAYLVHVVRKNTNGSEQHDYSYRWAPPGEHIETDKLRVPKVDVNTASLRELESIAGIGPKRAGDLVAARPLMKDEDVASILGERLFEAIKPSIKVC